MKLSFSCHAVLEQGERVWVRDDEVIALVRRKRIDPFGELEEGVDIYMRGLRDPIWIKETELGNQG